jgi:hypothetical protein
MNDRGAVLMLARQILVVPIVALFFLLSSAAGDQQRYYQDNGITYCETRRTVQRPVCETQMQPTTRTVYKEQYYTETKDVTQVSWRPVTTYQADTHWVGILNPFVEPALETQWIPQTSWQMQTQVVKMPVTCRKLVSEVQQVQVPVTSQKMVSQEVVVSRVPVGGPVPRVVPPTIATPAQSFVGKPGSINSGEQIGGIARLSQDPPRYGVGTTGKVLSTR